MAEKPRRKDKRRMVLRKGESQRKDGSYDYRWTTRDGKRHSIYAKTLEELREKEDEVANDQYEGIRVEGKTVTVNDIFEMWCNLKRGMKDNTFQIHVQPECQTEIREDAGQKSKEIGRETVLQFPGG